MTDRPGTAAAFDATSVAETTAQPGVTTNFVVPLLTEEAVVTRRTVETAVVKVATVTRTRDTLVDEPLVHERVEVERVPVGRVIEAVPPIREEGDTTIIPVIEEIVVVERRLVLKEEVHIRRIRVTEQHRETVVLREQTAVITRVKPGDDPGA